MTLHRGRGFAAINYPIGMNLGGDPSQALVHSNPDGKFTVALSSIDLGQGLKSVTRQICGASPNPTRPSASVTRTTTLTTCPVRRSAVTNGVCRGRAMRAVATSTMRAMRSSAPR